MIAQGSEDRAFMFDVHFDYYQFYVGDRAVDPEVYVETCWSDEEEVKRGLAVAPGIIVVRTEDVGAASVTLQIRNAVPDDDINLWDYVAEASIEVPSGHLVVDGFPYSDLDVPPDIPVSPKAYRVRFYHNYIAHTEERQEDRYRVVIWPASSRAPEVLRLEPHTE